jgi:hypothetical protein
MMNPKDKQKWINTLRNQKPKETEEKEEIGLFILNIWQLNDLCHGDSYCIEDIIEEQM